MAYYYWTRDAEAIDLLLRAAVNGRAIEPRTPEEEEERAQADAELREAFGTRDGAD